jgi:lipoprotein-anchoring transpeptidase ErfK/SrfK
LPPGSSLVAVARGRVVAVHRLATGRVAWRLHNPNAVGAPVVFLVVGARAGGWVVRVPARPNGSRGWVADSAVRIEVDPYALRASLRRHRLTVLRDGRAVASYPIGVGRPSAPTPTGSFYLTELLQPRSVATPYGPFAYGTSAFSSTYSEFEGGPGQIGIHGTDDPSSIGRNVSHGCIRMHDSDVAALARLIPAGTPLTISA